MDGMMYVDVDVDAGAGKPSREGRAGGSELESCEYSGCRVSCEWCGTWEFENR